MFNRFHQDKQLEVMRLSPDEICGLAAMNLAAIHETAAHQMSQQGTSIEGGLAVLNMTAQLCYPGTYTRSPAEAIEMVEEILSLLPKAGDL
jgi:hypothetical protein